ncbi:hypothetical protein AGMMS49983_11850 [Clostridia bacterium]|nr:hypothetical protein AGMMS49983_11850 [Clostridia bacterium]
MVIAVVIVIIAASASSGGLKGTYYAEYPLNYVSFGDEGIQYIEFKSFGKAEIGTIGIFSGRTTYEDCTYKISGSSITLKAEWNTSAYSPTQKEQETYSFRESGNRISLEGVEYVK